MKFFFTRLKCVLLRLDEHIKSHIIFIYGLDNIIAIIGNLFLFFISKINVYGKINKIMVINIFISNYIDYFITVSYNLFLFFFIIEINVLIIIVKLNGLFIIYSTLNFLLI